MLSLEQKQYLRVEWRSCPTAEKKELMAEFIRDYGDDPGWEAWLAFLGERLNIPNYEESGGMS